MAEYKHKEVERKWQRYWADNKIFEANVDHNKPKFYVLDMFPYPSGAGLHVGHPLGYIASDIVSRFKRNKGYNVLHPMGFDAFGLPAEQYAIQTGQHPALTTAENIKRYKDQLQGIGLSYDWDKEVRTCDPKYYKWTQWIFSQLFSCWYNYDSNKAESIETLIAAFEKKGNKKINAACDDDTPIFDAAYWNRLSEAGKAKLLLKYRLTYPADALVNWCPALGTVLANDEVKDGFSERGGHPVERKKMRQWMMRITAYADRLVGNLNKLDWSASMKDMQTNWIGKSYGCELDFEVYDKDIALTCFTTRPDTIFGVTYMVLAPEHELVRELTTEEHREEVEAYVQKAINRSERERMSEIKTVSGVFTGSFVINPFTNEKVPLWIADYVLAGYGTGVVMAVPSSDDRDFRFATYYGLPVKRVIAGTEDLKDPTEIKHGKMINSGFITGMDSSEAVHATIDYAEKEGFGTAKVNYRIRDAVFSRQRYWGEPVPVYFTEDGIPRLLPESELPLELPPIDEYLPTKSGEPPLGRAKKWLYKGKYAYELTTMPGWAGSSWYFLRYMDASNDREFVSKEAAEYWNSVDLYIGGTEHATGHLLYSRFWNLFLYDRGYVTHEEPFQKLVNQGMIQGRSNIAYKLKDEHKFISAGLKKKYDVMELHVDVNIVHNDILDVEAFKKWMPDYKDAEFELEDGKFRCDFAIEKMSKRWYNVVNPDDVIEKYGADTLRMYEMFLGPIELSKPWNTHGIDGVAKFLRRLWALFYDADGKSLVNAGKPKAEEYKALHKTIQKVEMDIENLSFNTSVSEFMICVNALTQLNCHKKEILEKLLIVLSPFAPHIAEELWQSLGHEESIIHAEYPEFDESYIKEDEYEFPVMVNGKMRTKIKFALDKSPGEIENEVLENDVIKKWLDGKSPKKVIVVPKKIVNVVV
ncbi:MAG: leucine--tRNA ligase [Cytophagales bacterium]|nr:leucine--tRNA ligase [Cytophagales bacterium]